jgi:arylsulfatase A-like enzyme
MFGGMGDHWNVPAYHFDPSGNYDTRYPYIRNPQQSRDVEYRQCDHIHPGVHSTDLFADATEGFLQSRDRTMPFFAYVSLMAPHDPRSMPQKYLNMYDPSRIRLPESFLPEHPIDTGALRIRDEVLAAFPRSPEEIRTHIAEYYAMISHLDDALGRLIGRLRDSGDLENTIVVFAGDNGLALGRHGLMGKQNLYDHSVRIPLIFSGPGVPRGESSDALVYLLDIFPALCDLVGVAIPESVEGASLSPCFASPNATMRDQLYLAYGDSIRGISDGSHKLIEYACGETQLFDLVDDLHEMHSLSGGSASAAKIDEIRGSLARLRDEWDDPEHPTGERFWGSRDDLQS